MSDNNSISRLRIGAKLSAMKSLSVIAVSDQIEVSAY
jgi:hypothetical protein